MVEVIGDIVIPSTFIIPWLHRGELTPTMSGAMFLSGATLWIVSPLSGATQIQSQVTD